MRTEPTLIIGFVRAAIALAATFGYFLTVEQGEAIINFLMAALPVVSILLTLWNRNAVFAPATVDRLLEEEVPPPVDPPQG